MKPINYKHLGFTGTKRGITPAQRSKLKTVLSELRLDGFLWMHNGDCVGADDTAGKLWSTHPINGMVMLHPPDNPKFRAYLVADITCEPRGYIHRDRHIVLCSHTLVATPGGFEEEVRSGTWTTIRYARTRRRRIYIIYPDGSVGKE